MAPHILKLLSSAASETPDAELVARFVANRDDEAFTELTRRHGPAVYRICRQVLGATSAEDAFQATFLVLACRARSVRKAASVGNWLIGVAGRVSRQMRKQSRRASPADVNDAAWIARTESDCTVESAELSAIVAEELSRLPDGLRGPVVLCLLEGRTHAQAAVELGGSARTVRRRLTQAKALLRLRLERRGIVPAVAAGMIASIGPAAAVPPDLVKRTIDGAFSFLTGSGAVTPAAVVAKGVMGSMVKIKASAAMAIAAISLIGLGVVLADEKPAPVVHLPSQRIPKPPATPPTRPAERAGGQEPRFEATSVTIRTANFVVTAPKPWMARAIANEAEYQRRELAKLWLGKELPYWPEPCRVSVNIEAGKNGGSTSFTFQPDRDVPAPRTTIGEMVLQGSFEAVLTGSLPHEVMHTILASHFGKPLPRWVDEGIAMTAEPPEEQARSDASCREFLAAGRGIRLRELVKMKDYPRDMMVLYAQGHSVVRFLLSLQPDTRFAVFEGGSIGRLDKPNLNAPGQSEKRQGILLFILVGGSSWDSSAQVYGFKSVDELEEAWLEWLKKPESELKVKQSAKPVQPLDMPGLIPPVMFPVREPQP